MNENSSTALAVIKKAQASGALVYAPQNLDCPVLYKAEATAIQAKPDEFHNIQGKFLPSRAVVDRISEASGVDFISEQCNVETRKEDDFLGKRTIHIGHAQGRVRLPDGSWRHSAVEEYEWDPLLRAEMDAKGDESKKRRLTLEYMKVSAQRAATGARLRVIRALTGIPATFSAEEIKRPMVFSRIVQNTDYILGTKEGRIMAMAAATGVTGKMFGQQAISSTVQEEDPDHGADIHAEPQAIHTTHEVMEATKDFDDMGASAAFDNAIPDDEDRREPYFQALRDWRIKYEFHPDAIRIIDRALGNPMIELEDLKNVCTRCDESIKAGRAKLRGAA